MQLPESLQEALVQEMSGYSSAQLKAAAEQLSAHYRGEKNSKTLFEQGACRLAYLLARMPATYAAIVRVLKEVQARVGAAFEVRSILDLGAGPGTGGWAASEVFANLARITCIEQSAPMASLGKKFFCQSDLPALRTATWVAQEVKEPFESVDLALLSYVVGELKGPQTLHLLGSIFNANIPLAAIIEPGTKAGFQRILSIRSWAIEQGLRILAPCPHRAACPMKRGESWCHFPARVERSRIHKFLKEGSLGYEDEKFSYIVLGKILVDAPSSRIVGNVQKMSGFVRLPVCAQGQIKEIIVSKKQEDYRQARNANWGDAWNSSV